MSPFGQWIRRSAEKFDKDFASSLSPWEQFLFAIERAKSELGCSDRGAWFRGVRNSKYRLYPPLFRPESKVKTNREADIYFDYTDRFGQRGSGQEKPWEILVRIQHYGSPTRLLDWTEVLGIAIFFAIREIHGKQPKSPAIWVINPFRIAKKARRSEDKSIGDFNREPDMCYYTRFIKNRDWPFHMPMPFRPPKSNERIRAQRGFFTVHGTNPLPLDAQFRGDVRQVRLKPEVLQDAEHYLRTFGIDALTLFPDHEGFNEYVQETYKYK